MTLSQQTKVKIQGIEITAAAISALILFQETVQRALGFQRERCIISGLREEILT